MRVMKILTYCCIIFINYHFAEACEVKELNKKVEKVGHEVKDAVHDAVEFYNANEGRIKEKIVDVIDSNKENVKNVAEIVRKNVQDVTYKIRNFFRKI